MSSKSKPAASRFSGQLSNLAGRPAPEPVEEQSKETKAAAAPESTDTLETFSSHMKKDMKRRLKVAAAKEGRKQYEIVGELVEAWLAQRHPDV